MTNETKQPCAKCHRVACPRMGFCPDCKTCSVGLGNPSFVKMKEKPEFVCYNCLKPFPVASAAPARADEPTTQVCERCDRERIGTSARCLCGWLNGWIVKSVPPSASPAEAEPRKLDEWEVERLNNVAGLIFDNEYRRSVADAAKRLRFLEAEREKHHAEVMDQCRITSEISDERCALVTALSTLRGQIEGMRERIELHIGFVEGRAAEMARVILGEFNATFPAEKGRDDE